jgi:hypothetical protein
MENYSNIEKLYVRYLINAASEADVVQWAIDNYQLNNESELNHKILEIGSLSLNSAETKSPGILLSEIIKKFFPEFEKHRVEIAMDILKDLCRSIVDQKIRAYELCKVVGPIELSYYFPPWLGNLSAVCDCCETVSIVDESLLEEAKNRLIELD